MLKLISFNCTKLPNFHAYLRENYGDNQTLAVPFGSDLEQEICATFLDEGLSLERCALRFNLAKSVIWRLIRKRHGIKPFKAKVIFFSMFNLPRWYPFSPTSTWYYGRNM